MTRRIWKCRKRERTWLSCCRRFARPGEWITTSGHQGTFMAPTYRHRFCPGVVD